MEKKKTKVNKNTPAAKRRGITTLDGLLLKEMVTGGAEELRSNVDEVNRLNVFPVPDGDTGDNMFSTIDSGVKAIEGLDTDNLAEVMRVLSHGMLLGARGNSGVILSQFFKGVADGFQNSQSADPKTLGAALELGVKEAYSTVMTPTEGTILTVAREAVEAAVAKINPRTTIKSFFNDFVKELHASVERTPESLPALKEAGVVDSGGAGLFYLMDGFNRVLRAEKSYGKKESGEGHTPSITDIKERRSTDTVLDNLDSENECINTKRVDSDRLDKAKNKSFDENTDMKFSYCTELLVQLTRVKCDTGSFNMDKLREFLASVGDSGAAVKSGTVLKIHVHTFSPDKVLEHLLKFGEFLNVKVENMSLQHSELYEKVTTNYDKSKELFTSSTKKELGSNSPTETIRTNTRNTKRKKYGIVSVSNGDGIDRIFRELGADETINSSGGNNPSAQAFLESAKLTGAENVFLFPNNKNFILAAEQAAKMESDITIHVVPSKSIAHGYAALSVINLECDDCKPIIKALKGAIDNTSVGSVFTAARDTKCSGIKIKNGEFVGAVESDIVAKSKSVTDTALKICKKLLLDKFMLTVFIGKDAKDKDVNIIEKRIKKTHPKVEIYFIGVDRVYARVA